MKNGVFDKYKYVDSSMPFFHQGLIKENFAKDFLRDYNRLVDLDYSENEKLKSLDLTSVLAAR